MSLFPQFLQSLNIHSCPVNPSFLLFFKLGDYILKSDLPFDKKTFIRIDNFSDLNKNSLPSRSLNESNFEKFFSINKLK
jgi:hypothetical protein